MTQTQTHQHLAPPGQVTHHLTPELLMAYSAGTLPEAFSLVVATHLSICDSCRADAASYDTVGGAVLDSISPDAGACDFEATLARITSSPAQPATAQPLPDDVIPSPLAAYIGGGLDAVKWKKVGGGVRQAILPTSSDATARLLYIPAGTAVPDHGHRGTELTLVLQGAFSDEDGRYARGDVEIADEDVDHTPIAETGADCICLAATDAPLRFAGWLPRMLQPFVKI